MCVTLHDARLGRTTIAGWRYPPARTHCLIYGNEPRNLVSGPNAMILHIPIAPGCELTQANFIPMDGARHLLDDMWAAAPKWGDRHMLLGGGGPARSAKGISVFDQGAYTWVAATRADPEDIARALAGVREDRRTEMSLDLIRCYRQMWPFDALAIGCFANAGGHATDPAGIEYPPQDWRRLRMPAVDAHGEIPGFRRPVTVNHRLIVGTTELGVGGRPRYRGAGEMDPRLIRVLPRQVVAAELDDIPMPNGDFYVDFANFGQDGNGNILRAHGPELTAEASRVPVPIG